MKKLMIAAAIVCAAAFAQAATVDWMICASELVPGPVSGDYTGSAILACSELDWSTSVSVDGGYFEWTGQIESEVEAEYTFTITASDPASGKSYSASGVGMTDSMKFGMATIGAGTWTAVPEPTSGLLLLLGVAGLALRARKRA